LTAPFFFPLISRFLSLLNITFFLTFFVSYCITLAVLFFNVFFGLITMGFFKSVFSFSGFMDRGDYWKAVILYAFLPACVLAFSAFLCNWYDFQNSRVVLHPVIEGKPLTVVTTVLFFYVVYVFTFGMLAIMSKRLRDISISPLFSLLYFILPISPFVLLLYGMFPTNVNAYER